MGIFDQWWNASEVADQNSLNIVTPGNAGIRVGPIGTPLSTVPGVTTPLNMNAFPNPYGDGSYGRMSDPYAKQRPKFMGIGDYVSPTSMNGPNVPAGGLPQVAAPATGIPAPTNAMLPAFGGDVLSGLLSDAGVTGVTAPSPMAGIPAVAGAAVDPAKGGFWGNTFGNGEGGLDLDKLGTAFDGLKSIFGIWGGMKQLGMAKDAYEFEKKSYQENVANQKKTYNSTLEDRQRARAAFAGESDASVDEYVKKHRL